MAEKGSEFYWHASAPPIKYQSTKILSNLWAAQNRKDAHSFYIQVDCDKVLSVLYFH